MFKLLNKTIELHLTFRSSENKIEIVEEKMRDLKLKYYRRKEFRRDDEALYQYDVIGKEHQLNYLVSFLNESTFVKSFNY